MARGRKLSAVTGDTPGRVPKAKNVKRWEKRRDRWNPTPAPTGANTAAGDPGYALEYSPTAESQLNQPYQDVAAAGAFGSLMDVLGRQGQQGQMADIYGAGTATQLGGAARGMEQLNPLGGGYMDQSGQNLGQYGALQNPNFGIQAGVANQALGSLAGDPNFDPFLTQQFNTQEQQLREQLRRNLGPDYENSSPGIEALARFNQGKTTALGSAQFNRLGDLVGMQQGGLQNLANQGLNFGQFGASAQQQQFGQGAQLGQMYGQMGGQLYDQAMGMRGNQLGGAGQLLNQQGTTQELYNNVPSTLGEYGERMGGMSRYSIAGQQPYQQDRFTKFTNFYPSENQFKGMMLGQTGDRWQNVGGGGGGPTGGQQDGMNAGSNQWGGAAGTGEGDPGWLDSWGAAGG
jgi:hypothetical protein